MQYFTQKAPSIKLVQIELLKQFNWIKFVNKRLCVGLFYFSF